MRPATQHANRAGSSTPGIWPKCFSMSSSWLGCRSRPVTRTRSRHVSTSDGSSAHKRSDSASYSEGSRGEGASGCMTAGSAPSTVCSPAPESGSIHTTRPLGASSFVASSKGCPDTLNLRPAVSSTNEDPSGLRRTRVTVTSTPLGRIWPLMGACPSIPKRSPRFTSSPTYVPPFRGRVGSDEASNWSGKTWPGTEASKTRSRRTSIFASFSRMDSRRCWRTRRSSMEMPSPSSSAPSLPASASGSSDVARAIHRRLARTRAGRIDL
mmetsp:Transcript_3225/g.14604  ORF Transcript_3225/g.14604 Transcript_3225/m.14604 type:complete len:267 (-) Transcript_3225:4341-5141(-)